MEEIDVYDRTVTAAEHADRVSAHVRALNYATMPGQLDYPSDVAEVIANVKGGVYGLSQALEQMANFLQDQLAAGNVGAVQGWRHAGDPAKAVEDARAHLIRAGMALQNVHGVLEEAHSDVAGLEYIGPPLDE